MYIHAGMYISIKIDEPQLPWLQTAIHVCHTDLDVKNESHRSAQDTFHTSSDAYHVMRKTRIQTTREFHCVKLGIARCLGWHAQPLIVSVYIVQLHVL